MRVDGRRTDELRPVRIEVGYTRYAEGSVLITQGQTIVLCNATVEDRLPPWMVSSTSPQEERGWVTAEYSMLPRSTHTRTRRETTPQPRTQEIRRIVARSLRAAVDLSLLGRRQVIVDCDVLQADGGTRTASVTGGYVALALAAAAAYRWRTGARRRPGRSGGGGQRGGGRRRADDRSVL